MILMACTAALIASAHAAPFEHAKLSIDKQNIKVWTYKIVKVRCCNIKQKPFMTAP